MIPRLIHTVWVGDNSKAPEKTIETWRAMNPNWHVMVWRNEDLAKGAWRNRHWIEHWWPLGEMCGVADVMRWQILEDMGGFAVDADAPCLRPLDEWIFDVTACACWENEIARPGLINNGFVACEAGDPLVTAINRDLEAEVPPEGLRAWQTTGPVRLTATWQLHGDAWTIWPSHLFLPRHFSGHAYTGRGPVYAEQKWGSTVGYEGLT
ncbi:MAG: glycosyltransferase [Phycisphaerae bacterium]|jgi:mannosyltransferase OCH1-like enzyme